MFIFKLFNLFSCQSKLTPTHYLFITRSHLVPLTKPLTKKRKRPLRQQKHSRSAELVYDFYEMDCLQKVGHNLVKEQFIT